MSLDRFELKVNDLVAQFPENQFMKRLDRNELNRSHYQSLLLMLLHQTVNGPGALAMAGAMLPPSMWEARQYLLHHADEEKTHWQWILNDLSSTGYSGSDPRESPPHPACAAYIGYNYYIALRYPIARLAIAAVLEGIGATHGKVYALKVGTLLHLRSDQLQFFLGHGDTDVGHTREIFEVLGKSQLSREDWRVMGDTASTALVLYRAMYDEAVTKE